MTGPGAPAGGAARPSAAGEREVLVGVILMAAATQVQPMMDAAAKYVGGQISPLQVAWARMAVQMTLMLPVVLWLHGAGGLLPRPLGLQMLRGLFIAGATAFFFFAISMMPLADAVALVFVAPLIVTSLSGLVLGERVEPRRWLAVVVGFAGALIVIRPGSGLFGAAAWLPLAAATCYASYLLVTRRLTASAHPLQTHFFTALAATVLLGLPLISGGIFGIAALAPAWPDRMQLALLVLVGVLSTISHLLILLAYGRAPAPVLAPIGYLEIVGATIIGFLIFGDFPDSITLVGVGVIVASGLYVVLGERRASVSARMHGRRAGR